MQIHEITKLPVNEGIASALGNIVGGARAGASALGQKLTGGGAFSAAMKDPVRQQQIKMLSDKTYGAWKAYEKDLLRTNPDARETGMYEQALLAFVSKNLLGGQYLPNVINQAQIKALVKQLSGTTGQATKAEEPITMGGKTLDPKNPKDAEVIAALRAQGKLEEASTPNEKDLWLKLIQQAAIAQTQAPGAQTSPGNKPSPNTQSNQGAGDARSYAQKFTQDMEPGVVKGLPIFGNESIKLTGDNRVSATGNPVADALLLMAGFRGI